MMVLCVISGCRNRSDRNKGIGYYRVLSVIENKGEIELKLSSERRQACINAISRGDTKEKNVLATERVCGKHFVSVFSLDQVRDNWN